MVIRENHLHGQNSQKEYGIYMVLEKIKHLSLDLLKNHIPFGNL